MKINLQTDVRLHSHHFCMRLAGLVTSNTFNKGYPCNSKSNSILSMVISRYEGENY